LTPDDEEFVVEIVARRSIARFDHIATRPVLAEQREPNVVTLRWNDGEPDMELDGVPLDLDE
jgi:hypothetical protein